MDIQSIPTAAGAVGTVGVLWRTHGWKTVTNTGVLSNIHPGEFF